MGALWGPRHWAPHILCAVICQFLHGQTIRKQVKIFPNQKPWLNTNIRALLQARDSAMRSRDREAYRKARADLNRGVKAAKTKCRKQIEANFKENNCHSRTTLHSGLSINREEVERVTNFNFLGLHISEDLGGTVITTHIIKKAQQHLFFLRMLRRNKLPPHLLKNF